MQQLVMTKHAHMYLKLQIIIIIKYSAVHRLVRNLYITIYDYEIIQNVVYETAPPTLSSRARSLSLSFSLFLSHSSNLFILILIFFTWVQRFNNIIIKEKIKFLKDMCDGGGDDGDAWLHSDDGWLDAMN